jgi:hypothetical protein
LVIRRVLCCLLLAGPVLAQSLRVLSEFQRVDPFGDVVPVDRTPQPREILSPGVVRNAFASFHIVASAPEREPFFIYVETNPPDVFRISLYKELYVKSGDGWIPDVLEPMKQPIFDTLPYFPMPIAGQTTVSYWMDVWVPADAAINRVRLEVLMKIGSGWIMYPMEVRVMPAVAPAIQEHNAALPPASARADAAVYGPFRNFLCNAHEPGRKERLTVRRLIHRNAEQDLGLARALEGRSGDLRVDLLRRSGVPDKKQWCPSPAQAQPPGAEWFLRVRDAIYRKGGAAPD